MKKIHFVFMLLGMVFVSTSCEDDNKNYTDEFAAVLYYKDEFKEFDFYNVNEDVVLPVTVIKGGHNPEIQTEITLVPFTEEEMTAYNTSTGQSYKLLPPEYYITPATVTIASGERYKIVDVIFKSTIGSLAGKTNDYLLPFHLISSSGRVNEDKSQIYLKPNVMTPFISMEQTGEQEIRMDVTDADEPKSFDINVYLDMVNEWEFSVDIEADEEELQAAVEAYNTHNGVHYGLLPQANRAFVSSLPFTGEENSKTLSVTLNKEGLSIGDYLLPVILKGCEGMPFYVSEDICYIHVMVTETLPEISLKDNATLSASSTVQWGGEGIENLWDGNTGTHWQSIWTSWGDIPTALHDPTYGVYIDISLSGPYSVTKQVAFEYATRKSDGDAVPNHIVIYAGTSKDDIRIIGELKRAEDQLPITGDTWFKSKNFSLGGGDDAVTFLRLAILSQYNAKSGSVADLTAENFKSVVISELRLYGK